MPPLIAAFFYTLLICGLFALNRERKAGVSKALWLPAMWLFVAVSRNVSDWLGMAAPGGSYVEGSPLDRAVLSVILGLGVIVLVMRGRRVGILLRTNAPILLYFLYCVVSAYWSDFSDVALRRWFRACGDVVMILIVLSEPDWLAAIRQLFARLGFLLVPLSILFIKYYPNLGRTYSPGGRPLWVGVGTDKNALGMLCLVFGLAAVFHFIQLYEEGKGARKNKRLIAQGVLIAMAIYLLFKADSATAFACFFMAGGIMVITCLFPRTRKPAFVHVMVVAVLSVAFSALFLGIGTGLVQQLGRESTLTGRTDIWSCALGLAHDPFFGTGYASFWVGPRYEAMKSCTGQALNQAHNGYLEMYLNLGWVGLALLAGIVVTGYLRIVPAVRWQTQAGSLRLAYLVAAVAYNCTEAGFNMMHPMWIVLLLSVAVVPRRPVPEHPETRAEFNSEQFLAEPTARVHNPTVPAATSPDFVTRRKRFAIG